MTLTDYIKTRLIIACLQEIHVRGGEKDGGGIGGRGVHLSPQIHQEYTFRHRSACRKPAESGQEYLTRGKDYIDHAKLSRMKELGEKTGVRVGLDLQWVWELKQESNPRIRAIV